MGAFFIFLKFFHFVEHVMKEIFQLPFASHSDLNKNQLFVMFALVVTSGSVGERRERGAGGRVGSCGQTITTTTSRHPQKYRESFLYLI